jgi:site-specific DNA-methyltransferase (adenine-specific)
MGGAKLSYRVIHNDCLDTKEDIGLFHALFCDPPYELGFMGKDWDKSGVSFRKETWEHLSTFLLPGAFVVAFASSRGWHRLACAMEDAGLVIHPSIFLWAQGQGLQKGAHIGSKIDKRAGEERKIVGLSGRTTSGKPKSRTSGLNGSSTFQETRGMGMYIKEPVTELAKVWEGYRYGLQALKPSVEVLIIAQKPHESKVGLDGIIENGTGAYNIEACKIPGDGRYDGGRWPSNLILMDKCAAESIDEQSGFSVSTPSGYNLDASGNNNPVNVMTNIKSGKHYGDSGGASRFFYRVQEQIEESDQVVYRKKPSRKEKDAGLDNFAGLAFATDVMEETEEDNVSSVKNYHPTVKPIALAEYISKMLLPPAMYAPRRILVPFSGSGSEMIGALKAGWDEIVGIERDEDSVSISLARLAHHSKTENLSNE